MEAKKENKFKSRDIFYAVIALATLIVAIIGATLAYFSITASSAEGAVNAKSAVVSVNYLDSKQVSAAADQLIPATLSVVKQAYEKAKLNFPEDGIDNDATNECIDDNGRQVCSIFRFTIDSDEAREGVTAKLLNEENSFTYLAYAVYATNDYQADNSTYTGWLKLDEEDNEYKAINKCTAPDDNNGVIENPQDTDCYSRNAAGDKVYKNPLAGAVNSAVNSIFGYATDNGDTIFKTNYLHTQTKTFDIVLFILENEHDQNIDQGATYSGTIQVEVTDNASTGRITGHMN